MICCQVGCGGMDRINPSVSPWRTKEPCLQCVSSETVMCWFDRAAGGAVMCRSTTFCGTSEHHVVADVVIGSAEKLSPSLSPSSSPSVRRRKKTEHKPSSRKVNPAPREVIGFSYGKCRSIRG